VDGVSKSFTSLITSTGIPEWKAGRYRLQANENRIDAFNPNGKIAMIERYGDERGYLYSAAGGALNLQSYFTVGTKTLPYNDTHYSATAAATHTFVPADNITVTPPVTVDAVSNKEGCFNTNIPATTFSSPTSGVTFTWTNSNPGIGLAASGPGNQPAFTATNTGVATITVTPTYNGCTDTPITYTITIYSCSVPINPHLRTRVIQQP
jgi:hypothetical protein